MEDRLLVLERSSVLSENVSQGKSYISAFRSPGGESKREERGVERGSATRSSLKGRERAIVSQTNFGTVSKAVLGKLLRDGVERIRAFPSA